MFNFFKNKFSTFFTNKFDDIKLQIANGYFNSVRKKYPDLKKIDQTYYKVFSQNGEDGTLDYLIESLKIKNINFIELGVGDYSECNTRLISMLRKCHGTIIDQNPNLNINLKKKDFFYKQNLNLITKKINLDKFKTIISELNNIDLFSIDIDGIDYWLLNELPHNFCKIIVAEYNPLFGHKNEISVPYDSNFDRTNFHFSNLCYGASIKAIKSLLEKKGFILFGVNDLRNNAFFIRADEIKKINCEVAADDQLEEFCNFNFRESRDIKGKLTYLNQKDSINLISDCIVTDIKTGQNVKLSSYL